MKVIKYCEEFREKWEDFVLDTPEAANYHQIGWKEVIEKSFGHKTYYLMCMENDIVIGIFPLVFLKSLFFGRFIVSLPFFNYGSVLCSNEKARKMLLDEAIRIAKSVKASHIENRDKKDKVFDLPVKTSKVTLLLPLTSSPDELWKSFKSKLRSQIKRPIKEGMDAHIGGLDELDNFYKVFSINMRDLGTPVYTKNLFKNILYTFPEKTAICTVYLKNNPVGSAFITGFKGTVEVPWASTIREYNYASPNMLLYWNVLKYSCEKGYKLFDFGRSTPDSGTYYFKKQWGAETVQLYWYYWLRQGGALPELNPQNKKFEFLIKIWQKLPVELTKIIGPHIVKGLP